ncbi:nuclear transport factor 2 family protein [Caballeronia sp. DA-9]|uniref:nuclear transport factor 2 family protein n=1 Tax=Caballeronia sp. DA-9 TaxID=3436237 RepID=UPI003F667799
MTEHEILVGRYFDAWNEADASRREALAAQLLTENGRYLDPMMNSTGPMEFADMIGAFRSAMPGMRLQPVGGIDATGKMVRFSWRLIDATGRQFASGTDIGEFSIDGRFASITGFIDSALTGRDWSVEKYAAFWAAPDFSKPTNELAANIEGYWPGLDTPLKGVEAYVRPLHELLRRIPDFRLQVADHASRGDMVFIRWIATGTHGDTPLRFEGVDCVRHENGQVYENRIYCDHPLVHALNR